MTKRRFDKTEIWMFAGAALTLIVTVAAVVFSLGFVSTNLYRALSPDEDVGTAVRFNIDGYNALGL